MKRAPPLARLPVSALTALLVMAGSAAMGSAVGQEAPATRLHVTGEAGASLQDSFDGLRFGADMQTFGLRVTAERPAPAGFRPWVEGTRFVRPDFDCLTGLSCNDSGWLARGGVELPLSDADQRGLQASGRAGAGAAFSEDTSLSYLFGIGLQWRSIPWISPVAEVRWEHIAGINFTMIAAGLRVHF